MQATTFEWPEIIELELQAKHFKNTNFFHPCNCAISKAFMEAYPSEKTGAYAEEGLCVLLAHSVADDNICASFGHDWYGSTDFSHDHAAASAVGFDHTAIRKITLTKSPA